MYKIEIPHLSFENEKIETPVGLSELLESTWTVKGEINNEVVSKFHRTTFKKPNGRWVTKFEGM
ncbi:hypothetical protein ACXYMX_00280 [Sporosarcina sp. CAU 1771]